jgi:hypothetical protein
VGNKKYPKKREMKETDESIFPYMPLCLSIDVQEVLSSLMVNGGNFYAVVTNNNNNSSDILLTDQNSMEEDVVVNDSPAFSVKDWIRLFGTPSQQKQQQQQ